MAYHNVHQRPKVTVGVDYLRKHHGGAEGGLPPLNQHVRKHGNPRKSCGMVTNPSLHWRDLGEPTGLSFAGIGGHLVIWATKTY